MKPTTDDVQKWAQEAKLPFCHTTHPKALARFAELIASAEREKCADICDHEMDNAMNLGAKVAAGNCADRIRALGE